MTEGEKIIKLETQMTNIERKVDDGFEAVNGRLDGLDKVIQDFIEKSDKRYASKWVERVLWSTGGVVGTALILALLAQILVKVK